MSGGDRIAGICTQVSESLWCSGAGNVVGRGGKAFLSLSCQMWYHGVHLRG